MENTQRLILTHCIHCQDTMFELVGVIPVCEKCKETFLGKMEDTLLMETFNIALIDEDFPTQKFNIEKVDSAWVNHHLLVTSTKLYSMMIITSTKSHKSSVYRPKEDKWVLSS